MDQTNCSDCGKKVYKSLKFCPYCGKKQSSSFSNEEIEKNPYKILQISVDAEPEVVNAAYKSLSKKYHPDIDSSHTAQEKMKEINWAYSVLSKPDSRKEWDDTQNKSLHQKTSPQKQNSTTTARTEPRAKYQAVNHKKKPQRQHKSTKSPSSVKKKNKDIPGKIAALIIIMILILLILYTLSSTTSSPSAYSPPRNTAIPTTIKQTSTAPKPTSTPKPPTPNPDSSSIRPPYYEPFTIDKGLWYVGDDEEASFKISHGEYLIKPKKPGGSWWASPTADLDDVVLEFTTRFKYTYPSEDGGFFVNFRCTNSDDSQCYELFVSENGYLMVFDDARIIVDHGFSKYIKLYERPNEWAIVMNGSDFEIYCNDELLVTFSDTKFRRGDFGFGVSNSESDEWGFNGIAFDDIRVSRITD